MFLGVGLGTNPKSKRKKKKEIDCGWKTVIEAVENFRFVSWDEVLWGKTTRASLSLVCNSVRGTFRWVVFGPALFL